LLTLFAIALWGCTTTRYRESADEETYRIIREKQQEVFGEAQTDFTIEKQPLPEFIRGAELEQVTQTGSEEKTAPTELSEEEIESVTDQQLEALLELSHEETAQRIIPPPPKAVKLTLAQTLELAVANSREFQGQKESFFMRGLGLTYQRHLWRPQLGLSGSATGKKEGEEKSIGAEGKFSLRQLLSSGGQLALNLGTNLAEFFTGDRRRAVGSLLSLTFSQSLLRGGGRLVAMESLTQAERNVVYDVRSFARFRKQFSVQQVAQEYYGVLQERDALINSFRNYISMRRGSLEEIEKQKANLSTMLDVYETRRYELTAKNAWIFASQAYLDVLDRFKINPLGLPTEAPIVLDEKELQVLIKRAEAGLRPPEVTIEEAVSRALANRLDLLNAEDALEDSERAVALARDALRAGLDISISTSADTEPETKAIKFRFNESPYTAGLSFDLPIDRKQERNAYRQALISLESQKRSLSLLRDNIKLQVRQAYRNLEKTRKSYEIQKMIVEQAETRVDIAEMEREFGDATSHEVLRAKEDLVSAQNALTSALVSHEIARLQLLLSMEALQVDEKGLWVDEEPSERGDENVETTQRAESEKEELSES